MEQNLSLLQLAAEQAQKLWDIHEIQNLMSRSTYLYTAGMYEEMCALFAPNTLDISAQISGGERCEGKEGVHKMMVDYWQTMFAGHTASMKKLYPQDENPTGRNGLLDLQALSSPVIEVAGDGQTAKGLWLAPSLATECHPGDSRPGAHWVWLKFAVDFIKEDGKWYFWHYRILPSFNTSFEKSWVDSSLAHEEMDRAAGRPEKDHLHIGPEEFRAYSVHEPPRYFPKPPEPYTTFSETFRY